MMDRLHALPDDWGPRYLRLLGLEREEPSRAALARLTRQHLLAVPFGNVTALLRYRDHVGAPPPPLDLDALLRLWERGQGVGVCFEVAAALGCLLSWLGYEVEPVPGMVLATFMGGHQALVVTLGAERYMVDVGNGAPFFDPIHLSDVSEVRHAGLTYRFGPGAGVGEFLQERWVGDRWTPHCRYALEGESDAEREASYRRNNTPHASFVIRELRLVRCTAVAVHSLRDGALTSYTVDGKRMVHLHRREDYVRAVSDVFRMPALPVLEALAVLDGLGDAPVAS